MLEEDCGNSVCEADTGNDWQHSKGVFFHVITRPILNVLTLKICSAQKAICKPVRQN